MELKDKFLEIYEELIRPRENCKHDIFLQMLEKSDFYTAPASSRYHHSEPDGLLKHSVEVFENLKKLSDSLDLNFDESSIAICALFHDLCKIEFYTISSRNVKNEKTGQWEKVPYYAINDKFPVPHSQKSVIILQKYLDLTNDEILAISSHMGSNDKDPLTISNAFNKSKLAVALHMADMMSAYYLIEENNNQ